MNVDRVTWQDCDRFLRYDGDTVTIGALCGGYEVDKEGQVTMGFDVFGRLIVEYLAVSERETPR